MTGTVQNLLNQLFSIVSGKQIETVADSKKNSKSANLEAPILSQNKTPDIRNIDNKVTYKDIMTEINNADLSNLKDSSAIKQEQTSKNSLKAKPNTPEAPKKEAQNNSKYTIKSGDTFAKIAGRTPGVTTQMILDANPGINPKNLKVGQSIIIPTPSNNSKNVEKAVVKTDSQPAKKPAQKTEDKKVSDDKSAKSTGGTYTVKKGDTLWQIAQDNNISVAALKKANNLGNIKYLTLGQKLTIPEPVIHSNMKVDASKEKEYKEAIFKMMEAKGFKDKNEQEKIASLITKKAISMKVDPVLIAGIISQEVDFRYNSDNIWGVNGKGIMQLTYKTVKDLFRCQPGVAEIYSGCRDEVLAIMKKYKNPDALYEAICKKENYELNMEVGIIIFKGKMEEDYMNYPKKNEKQHIESSVRNYNGNIKKKASGIEIRDDYRNKIIANYDKHKVS